MARHRYTVTFTVEDGVIVRTSTDLQLEVPKGLRSVDEEDTYVLKLGSSVHSRLTAPVTMENYASIYGPQVAAIDHPDYKVGGPARCMFCVRGDVTYTPTVGRKELVRLTSYNLSCITRWHPCRTLEDIWPAAKQWHLYSGLNAIQTSRPKQEPPAPCVAQPRALARDADLIIEADILSTHTEAGVPETSTPDPFQVATLHVRSILKGSAPFSPSQRITVTPYSNAGAVVDGYAPENFMAEGHPVVVSLWPFPDHEASYEYAAMPCGTLPDTPEVLDQIHLGISQDKLTRFGDTFDHEAPRYFKLP